MTSIPFLHGFAPLQIILELALLLALGSGIAWVLEKRGYTLGLFFKGVSFFVFMVGYFMWRVYPPIPFSLLAMYFTGMSLAVFGWVSSSEERWRDFCRPVNSMLDGRSVGARVVRGIVAVALPLMLAVYTYQSWMPVIQDPIELRTYHPAPPAKVTVYTPENFRQ